MQYTIHDITPPNINACNELWSITDLSSSASQATRSSALQQPSRNVLVLGSWDSVLRSILVNPASP